MGGMTLAMSASTFLVGFLLDRGIAPRALMAGCGLVAAAPIAFWVAVQPAFEKPEEPALPATGGARRAEHR